MTQEALQTLVVGELDEFHRLKVAEHLSHCDRCIEQYTELLSESVCVEPPQDMVAPVMEKIYYRRRQWAMKRYLQAAAAVVFALCLSRFCSMEQIRKTIIHVSIPLGNVLRVIA